MLVARPKEQLTKLSLRTKVFKMSFVDPPSIVDQVLNITIYRTLILFSTHPSRRYTHTDSQDPMTH